MIVDSQRPHIHDLYWRYLDKSEIDLSKQASTRRTPKDIFEQAVRELSKLFDDVKKTDMLEKGKDLPEYGRKALDTLLLEVRKAVEEEVKDRVERLAKGTPDFGLWSTGEEANKRDQKAFSENWQAEVEAIVRKFAKLDGYNVQLRSWETTKQSEPLKKSKSWLIPLRLFARNEAWVGRDGKLKGSHNEQGQVRSEYISDSHLYNTDGTVKLEHLDHDCIEFNDFNLSAGRYKPFTIAAVDYDPPAKIIRELQDLEKRIQTGLTNLLTMVEGRE